MYLIIFILSLVKTSPSCTSVSGPGFFRRLCGRAIHQHHSHQYMAIRLAWKANFCIRASLHTCGIQTTEDAENRNCQKHAGRGPETEI